jgi:hypothetical protein
MKYRVKLESGQEVLAPTLLEAEAKARSLGGGRVYCTCHSGFLMSNVVVDKKSVDNTPSTGLHLQ